MQGSNVKPVGEKLIFDMSSPDDKIFLGAVHFGLQYASHITTGELSEEAEAIKTRLESLDVSDILELSVEEAQLTLSAIHLRREFAIVRNCWERSDSIVSEYRSGVEAFAGEAVPVTVR